MRDPLNPTKKTNKVQSIALATALMITGMAIAKISGFLREVLIVYRFDVSYLSDAFGLGFQIPDLFYQLLIGGSIQAAITPTLARALEGDNRQSGWRAVSIFITFISLVMLLIVIAGIFLADTIFPIIYSEQSTKTVFLGAQVSKVLFIQVLFMMLAAFCIGILNAHKKFTSTAFGPTVYGVLVAVAILFLGDKSEPAVIHASIGVAFAAFGYFVFQLIMARKEITLFKPSLRLSDPGFKMLLFLAIPTMISASVVQLNVIALGWFSLRYFDEGTLTMLRNATSLWQIPYGIFAVAVGSVMLPSLVGFFARQDTLGAGRLLGSSLRTALFFTIPSAALMIILRLDIVLGVFKWSPNYEMRSAEVTSLMLMGYAVAIVLHTVVFLYNQAFYAIAKTRIAMINAIISLSLNIILSYLYIYLGLGEIAMPLAYSSTALISVILLVSLFTRDKGTKPIGMLSFFLKIIPCVLALAVTVFLLNLIPYAPDGKVLELAWLAARLIVGFAVYYAVAYLFKIDEVKSFWRKLKQRFGRHDNVQT